MEHVPGALHPRAAVHRGRTCLFKDVEVFLGGKNSAVKFRTRVSPRSEPGCVLTLK